MPTAVPATRNSALRTCSPVFVVAMKARKAASTAQYNRNPSTASPTMTAMVEAMAIWMLERR